jgi:hypothetical protein
MANPFCFETDTYLALLIAINERFARALEHLKDAQAAELGYLSAEEFALQVRMICESILASSFVVHRSKYAQIVGKFAPPNKPAWLAQELRLLNQGFMPLAVKPYIDADGRVGYSLCMSSQIDAAFLIRVHGLCGNFVHVPGEVNRKPKLSEFGRDFDRFLKWMNLYLAGHKISLYPEMRAYLFDGAGVVKGKPVLLSLDMAGAGLVLTLEAMLKSQ